MGYRSVFGHKPDDLIEAEPQNEVLCKEFEEYVFKIFPEEFVIERPDADVDIIPDFLITDTSSGKKLPWSVCFSRCSKHRGAVPAIYLNAGRLSRCGHTVLPYYWCWRSAGSKNILSFFKDTSPTNIAQSGAVG